MGPERDFLTGIVLDEQGEFTLGELCRSCGLTAEQAIEMVAEGILNPRGREPLAWRFRSSELIRIERAMHLQRDLRVNLPGVALALDLIEELEELRRLQRMFLE
jgi:chaperone modulatory protein CbpM